jgi:hypothetical protein
VPGPGFVLGLVAALLLAFYVAPYVIRGYPFAVGADAPVYVWWARLAGHDGLSAVGYRPGVPALVLVVRGTLGLSTVQAVAAVGAALAVAMGLGAAAAVAAAGPGRSNRAWGPAGLFAGLFAGSLANGYLSSLAAGVLFVAAIAALVARRSPAPWVAAALLGAAGLTHAAFFLVAAAVLLVAAAWGIAAGPRPRLAALRSRGSDEGHILTSVLGGTAIAGAGLLATTAIGPGPPGGADTSKDAFLRRTGLGAELHDLYRSRFGSNWLRSLLPAYAPLAAYGAGTRPAPDGGDPLLRRILLSWLAVAALGVVAGLVTGLLPGERFLSFAFALPILGAAGVVRLWRRGAAGDRGRDVARWARPVAGVAVAAVVVGSFLAWWHPAESFRDEDAAAAERAARVVQTLPAGTPVVFVVDDPHHAPLSVPRFGNELRGAMPPDRIRDVHLFVGGPRDYLADRPTTTGDALRDRLSARYLEDLHDALRGSPVRPVALVLQPMNEAGYPESTASGRVVAPGVAVIGPAPPLPDPSRLPAAPDPIRPTSPWLIVLLAVAVLAVLWVAGLGWARGALGGGVAAVAGAPAFGVAALVLAGVALDRVGIRLTGIVPLVVSVAVAAGGFLFDRRERRRDEGRVVER